MSAFFAFPWTVSLSQDKPIQRGPTYSSPREPLNPGDLRWAEAGKTKSALCSEGKMTNLQKGNNLSRLAALYKKVIWTICRGLCCRVS